MIILTLIVAILNISLGYTLAMRLGYGPPSLAESWEVFWAGPPPGPTSPGTPAAAEIPGSAFGPETLSDSLKEMLNEPYEETCDDPYDEAEEESVSEELDLDAPENWDLNERFVEASVLKLNIAMIRSGMKTTQIDTQLRGIQGKSDAPTVGALLAELTEDCRTYLGEQTTAAARFHNRIGELGELSELGDQIANANLEQTDRIKTTLGKLQSLDVKSDPEGANGRLLEEINRLRVARHKLRDDQQRAFLVIARYENRLDKIEKQLCNDPLTRLRNRVGLETTLWQWWQEGRHQSRPMSAALLDLDSFEWINRRHGSLAGDRILYQLAQVIRKHTAEDDLVVRFAGQQFLVLVVGVGSRAATKNIEFIRQSIERITFLYGDEEIRVTAGGGITEVTADDTQETLFARLEQSLGEAKRAGPNRSCFHDGEAVELVESPNLGAEYVEIPI